MLRLFKYVGFAVRFAPVIVSVVTLIEGLTSVETSGKDKKTLALATLRDVLGKFGVTLSDELETFISQVIDATVSLLNLLGVFKRKADVTEEEILEEAVVLAPAKVDAPKVAQVAVALREQEAVDSRLNELEAALRK